jgi:hypothetical protein
MLESVSVLSFVTKKVFFDCQWLVNAMIERNNEPCETIQNHSNAQWDWQCQRIVASRSISTQSREIDVPAGI